MIFEKAPPDSEYIIVEVKKPNAKDGKEQLRSYCNATGAIIGVWTNGHEDSLIASAVKAVELAVESSEQSALTFITKENLS